MFDINHSFNVLLLIIIHRFSHPFTPLWPSNTNIPSYFSPFFFKITKSLLIHINNK